MSNRDAAGRRSDGSRGAVHRRSDRSHASQARSKTLRDQHTVLTGAEAPVCRSLCHCAGLLRGTGVRVATVVGFPLGAATTSSKVWEAGQLVEEGAEEIDVVAAVGHIRDEAWDYVEHDICAVVKAVGGRTVKVILETAFGTCADRKSGGCSQRGGRALRQDVDRLSSGWRCYCGGGGIAQGSRGRLHGRESRGWHSDVCGRPSHDPGRRDSDRYVLRYTDREVPRLGPEALERTGA